MEKEISSGTMLGIVLIALAAVIGLGFGVFSIAKGVANEGTVGVQDNLAVVSESSFEDYNDKIVTGTQVKSAVTTFAGKSVGILIHNTAMDKKVVPYSEHKSIQLFELKPDGQNSDLASVFDSNVVDSLDEDLEAFSKPTAGSYYINYNALFGSTAAAAEITGGDGGGSTTVTGTTEVTMNTGASLKLKDGIYNAAGLSFAVDSVSGKVAFDNSVGGFGRTGNCEYIAATAKYDANLIKDEAGTTIGIVFTQRQQ